MQANCLCELGIYGIFLCDSDASTELSDATVSHVTTGTVNTPYINKYGGYLLRVKPANSDEGGVAAGYAVLSSPDLIQLFTLNTDYTRICFILHLAYDRMNYYKYFFDIQKG